jgi:CheY-like chemotaxis protein
MEKQKILVVEDEGIVSIDIRNILKKLGYSVPAVAFSGEEAISKAEETKPDLILMDIGLKGEIDGVEAAIKICDKHNIPVIFLTGFADDNTIQRAKTAKPAGYIIKPINEIELKKSIEDAFLS